MHAMLSVSLDSDCTNCSSGGDIRKILKIFVMQFAMMTKITCMYAIMLPSLSHSYSQLFCRILKGKNLLLLLLCDYICFHNFTLLIVFFWTYSVPNLVVTILRQQQYDKTFLFAFMNIYLKMRIFMIILFFWAKFLFGNISIYFLIN